MANNRNDLPPDDNERRDTDESDDMKRNAGQPLERDGLTKAPRIPNT